MLPDYISESSHTRSIKGPESNLIDAAEHVLADIQRRQRPLGGKFISQDNSVINIHPEARQIRRGRVVSDATERNKRGVRFHDLLKLRELVLADLVAHDIHSC